MWARTDNCSNYKKACRYLTNEYLHIAWQPCLAHTINLMLKTIGEFPDHEFVIDSAKLITRWLYNHGKFHTMMKTAIGENLVRWNATRFGINYLFLKSFLRRKDHFMQWTATPQLYFIATDVLTSKLMSCSYHFQLHGGKWSVTRHLHFISLQCDLSQCASAIGSE
jgi:hypothetical protein